MNFDLGAGDGDDASPPPSGGASAGQAPLNSQSKLRAPGWAGQQHREAASQPSSAPSVSGGGRRQPPQAHPAAVRGGVGHPPVPVAGRRKNTSQGSALPATDDAAAEVGHDAALAPGGLPLLSKEEEAAKTAAARQLVERHKRCVSVARVGSRRTAVVVERVALWVQGAARARGSEGRARLGGQRGA